MLRQLLQRCFSRRPPGQPDRRWPLQMMRRHGTVFEAFIAAQNAHNSDDVKALLWNSPATLLFARGIETRGRDAVADRFKTYYEGTWHLEPDMSKFHVAVISNEVMQVLVPIVFTRGLPGKPPQQNTFLISQTYVQDANGWSVASILPVANTELK